MRDHRPHLRTHQTRRTQTLTRAPYSRTRSRRRYPTDAHLYTTGPHTHARKAHERAPSRSPPLRPPAPFPGIRRRARCRRKREWIAQTHAENAHAHTHKIICNNRAAPDGCGLELGLRAKCTERARESRLARDQDRAGRMPRRMQLGEAPLFAKSATQAGRALFFHVADALATFSARPQRRGGVGSRGRDRRKWMRPGEKRALDWMYIRSCCGLPSLRTPPATPLLPCQPADDVSSPWSSLSGLQPLSRRKVPLSSSLPRNEWRVSADCRFFSSVALRPIPTSFIFAGSERREGGRLVTLFTEDSSVWVARWTLVFSAQAGVG